MLELRSFVERVNELFADGQKRWCFHRPRLRPSTTSGEATHKYALPGLTGAAKFGILVA